MKIIVIKSYFKENLNKYKHNFSYSNFINKLILKNKKSSVDEMASKNYWHLKIFSFIFNQVRRFKILACNC